MKFRHLLFLWIVCLTVFQVVHSQSLQSYKPFSAGESIYKYYGNIVLLDRKITGNLVIRRLNPDHFRMAFFSEMGLTYFDIEINPQKKITVHSMIPQLKNPFLKGPIRNLLRTLFMIGKEEDPVPGKEYVYFKKNKYRVFTSEIKDMQHYDWKKGKITITCTEMQDRVPTSFTVLYQGFPMKVYFSSFSEADE